MPTIKIKSADPASQGAFVIIDKSEYNPDVHELYGNQDLGAPADRVPTVAELLAARADLLAEHDNLQQRERELAAEKDRVTEQARANDIEALRLRDEAASLLVAKDAANAAASVPAATVATTEKPTKAAKA